MRIFIAVLTTVTILIGGLVWRNYTAPEHVLERAIVTKTPVGEVTLLTTLGKVDYQIVYCIGSDQPSVSAEQPYADRVNQWLRTKPSVKAEDSYWTLLFVDDSRIMPAAISRRYDLIRADDPRLNHLQLPANFTVDEWSAANEAAVYRLSLEDRDYFAFGRYYTPHP
jgi:hypothetical protein